MPSRPSTRDARRLRIGVVGGSLGGLTAALVLSDAGHEVEVFERSRAGLAPQGAGIVSHPMTLRYLRERCGVAPEEITTSSRRLRYLRPDGSVAHDEPSPHRFVSWSTLYRRLRDACQAPLHLGSTVTGVAQEEHAATVCVEEGARHEFDLVVAADGIGSATRAALLPHVSFRYGGYVGWRGTVPVDDLPVAAAACLADSVTYHVGVLSHLLSYPIADAATPDRRLVNFVWYRNVDEGHELTRLLRDDLGHAHALSVPAGRVPTPTVAALRADAERLLPAVLADLVSATELPFFQVIGDVEVPRMAFGRTVLVGDAAFVARPHAAAGTAKAAADAWALGEALTRAGPVSERLRDWEAGQIGLGRQLVARARDLGERSQVRGDWIPGDPALAFGLHGPGD